MNQPYRGWESFGDIWHLNTVARSQEDVAIEPVPEEFHHDVVEISRPGREPREGIAEDFGISPATLPNWLKAADIEKITLDGVTQNHAEDLRQLRRPKRVFEKETEVLRRATAYLSKASLKLGGFPKCCRNRPGFYS